MPPKYHVIVIGAGSTGTATAHDLALRGLCRLPARLHQGVEGDDLGVGEAQDLPEHDVGRRAEDGAGVDRRGRPGQRCGAAFAARGAGGSDL